MIELMDGVPIPDQTRLSVFTAEERPDFWEHAEASFPLVWPEYNLHGDVADQYFGALFPEHARVPVQSCQSSAAHWRDEGREEGSKAAGEHVASVVGERHPAVSEKVGRYWEPNTWMVHNVL